MRILVAHAFYRLTGGEDRYVEQQVKLLSPHHDVELLARRNEDLPSALAAATRMIYSPSVVAEAAAAFDRFAPDVAHLHNAYPAWGPAVHVAARRTSVPLVMTVHNFRLRCPNGFMFTEGRPCARCVRGNYSNAVIHRCFADRRQAAVYAAGLWFQRFLTRIEDRVTLFLTPSEFIAGRLRTWGIAPERIHVVRNFTTNRFGSATAGAYGAYVGRLSEEKGVDILLEALRVAGDPPFQIAGGGPDEARLRELAAHLQLKGVRFHGTVAPKAVEEMLSNSRFVVLPSLWDENAPLAALEAMAGGRPLLVSATGGLPELVANGEGRLVPPGDPGALADAIRDLMEDDAQCVSLGEKGLQRATREFTPDVHRENLERAYALAQAHG